jgi:hypothetical protein
METENIKNIKKHNCKHIPKDCIIYKTDYNKYILYVESNTIQIDVKYCPFCGLKLGGGL